MIAFPVPRPRGLPLYFFCAASNLFTASTKAFVCRVCSVKAVSKSCKCSVKAVCRASIC